MPSHPSRSPDSGLARTSCDAPNPPEWPPGPSRRPQNTPHSTGGLPFGQLARSVAPTTLPRAPSPIGPRQKVGVKRSRERPTSPTAHPGPVRPALDADPAEPDHRTDNGKGGKGGPPTTTDPPASRPPTSRPPSLLHAQPDSRDRRRCLRWMDVPALPGPFRRWRGAFVRFFAVLAGSGGSGGAGLPVCTRQRPFRWRRVHRCLVREPASRDNHRSVESAAVNGASFRWAEGGRWT